MTRLKLSIRPPKTRRPRQFFVDAFPCHIGRALENDLPLPYDSISGRHLVLEQNDEGEVFATDLGSTNGTHTSRMRLLPKNPMRLELPAKLRLGNVSLKVESATADIPAFTMAQSSTELRAIVDEMARQACDEDTHPFFEILSGPGSGQRILLVPDDQDRLIGTVEDCHITLALKGLPDHLATLLWKDGRCWLRAETEQLTMDDEPLQGHRLLRSGDRFAVGVAELLFFDPLEEHLEVLTPGKLPDPPESRDDAMPAEQPESPEDEELADQTVQDQDLEESAPPTPPADSPAEEIRRAVERTQKNDALKASRLSGLGVVELLLLVMAVVFLIATVVLLAVVLI